MAFLFRASRRPDGVADDVIVQPRRRDSDSLFGRQSAADVSTAYQMEARRSDRRRHLGRLYANERHSPSADTARWVEHSEMQRALYLHPEPGEGGSLKFGQGTC